MNKNSLTKEKRIKLFLVYMVKWPFKEIYKLLNKPSNWFVMWPTLALIDAWFLGPITFEKKIIWGLTLIPIIFWWQWIRGDYVFQHRQKDSKCNHEWFRQEFKVKGSFFEILSCKFCEVYRLKGGNE